MGTIKIFWNKIKYYVIEEAMFIFLEKLRNQKFACVYSDSNKACHSCINDSSYNYSIAEGQRIPQIIARFST